MGKQALISVSGIIGLGFLAYRTTDSSLHWGCLIGILALGFFGLGAVGFHGHKHPIEATLEGGEVVAWQQIQHAMAAKDMPRVPESPPVMEGLGQKRIGEKGANT